MVGSERPSRFQIFSAFLAHAVAEAALRAATPASKEGRMAAKHSSTRACSSGAMTPLCSSVSHSAKGTLSAFTCVGASPCAGGGSGAGSAKPQKAAIRGSTVVSKKLERMAAASAVRSETTAGLRGPQSINSGGRLAARPERTSARLTCAASDLSALAACFPIRRPTSRS